MSPTRQRLAAFFFPADSGLWLTILRMGLGLQVTLYAWSLRADWRFLFQGDATGPGIRSFTEAILTFQESLTPRISWLIEIGESLGGNESTVLSVVWLSLFTAGCLLFAGILCRPATLVAWLLYLCSVKSGGFFSYGVDHFTTIGLFYLMIAPFPGGWALGRRKKQGTVDPERLGFHRRVLQLHLCIIYFFGGLSKSLGVDWWNGNSVWRALTRPPFNLVSPGLLIHFEYLLPAIGILVCLLETGYPVFVWFRRTRVIWLTGIIFMHLSIGLTMGLYLFALIMIVLNLAAFGPEFFAATEKWVRSRGKRDDHFSAG